MMNRRQFFTLLNHKGFNLTEAQQKAVLHGNGPLLLLAVPGAGKTMVLTLRLAYLILVEGINPNHILCLTFGRAAAREMRNRFYDHFGDLIKGRIHFSTIHSYAYEIFRNHLRNQGSDQAHQDQAYQIMEKQTGPESKNTVLHKLHEETNGSKLTDDSMEELQNAITFVKNAMLAPAQLDNIAILNFAQLYDAYETYKLNHTPRLIDFDDMLSIAYQLLAEDLNLLDQCRKQFHYILTDESQDTSLLQHKIIEKLSQPNGNIFVVGDDDQSIFGFRAAEPAYLLNFSQVYAQAQVIRMEKNFRSTPEIVAISRELIRLNQKRYDKQMQTDNPAGETIQIRTFDTDAAQRAFVIDHIKNQQQNLAATAVLYRNNLSVIPLADALDRAGLPFYVGESNKLRFFNHWAVTDILNFLRMSYSDKNVDLLDLLKSKLQPFVNKGQIELLRAAASQRSVFDLLSEQETTKEKQKSYLSLKEQFQRLNKLPPEKAIQYIRHEMGYDKTVEKICDSLGFSQEYINTVLNILEAIAGQESTHPGFANRLNYLNERIDTSYRNKAKNVVTLSTIHSAKGLEWENVFVVDLVQGILPNYKAVNQADGHQFDGLEEERRLFYVAMTRAQKHLTLCTSKTYHNSPMHISQFVKEVQLLSEGKDPKSASKNRITDEFGEGLIVIHQSFGEGVIIDISENIVTVLFKDGSKRQLLKDLCEKKQLLRAK